MKRFWIAAAVAVVLAMAGAGKLVWEWADRRVDASMEDAKRDRDLAFLSGAMSCLSLWEWQEGQSSRARVVEQGRAIDEVLSDAPELRALRDTLVALGDYREGTRRSTALLKAAAAECSAVGVSQEDGTRFKNMLDVVGQRP